MKKQTKICLNCGKELEKSSRTGKRTWDRMKYCSRDCYFKGYKAHRANFKNGNTPWNKGKAGTYHHTEKARKEKSERMKGDKTHLWKGGVAEKNRKLRDGIELRLWREAVFARDNWTCQNCGVRGSTILNAHHIKSFMEYPELRTSIENGVTLCKACHYKKHSNYGKR